MDVQAGFFGAESLFFALRLPREVMWLDPERPEELARCRWDLLTLTQGGCASLESIRELFCACETLLVPGDCGAALLQRIRAERVVGYGVDRRDSLTLSSMGGQQKLAVVMVCALFVLVTFVIGLALVRRNRAARAARRRKKAASRGGGKR